MEAYATSSIMSGGPFDSLLIIIFIACRFKAYLIQPGKCGTSRGGHSGFALCPLVYLIHALLLLLLLLLLLMVVVSPPPPPDAPKQQNTRARVREDNAGGPREENVVSVLFLTSYCPRCLFIQTSRQEGPLVYTLCRQGAAKGEPEGT